MDSLITGLPQKEMAAMALGLAHRYRKSLQLLHVFGFAHFFPLLYVQLLYFGCLNGQYKY